MAIKIPTDIKPITDQRLTLIKIISQFTRKAGRLDELKNGVKKVLVAKDARYAESDLVIAELRAGGGGERRYVDQRKLWQLTKPVRGEKPRITQSQFLDVVCVRTSLLDKILSGNEIEKLYRPADDEEKLEAAGALHTDFKPDVTIDFDAIEAAIVGAALGLGKKAA